MKKSLLLLIFTALLLLTSCKIQIIDPNNPNNPNNPTEKAVEAVSVDTYEIFGDGRLIKTPQRLKAQSSPDDGVSAAALVGPWQGIRSSVNTEYGFADDGYFYKNVMITVTHMSSIYHPSHTEYGSYYNYYYSGWWENTFNYTYTYLDTLIGEYKVKGGVIQFSHVVAVSHMSFDDDWCNARTRSVSIEQLQSKANNAKMHDDFSEEFEFVDQTRLRLRNESSDMDLFWHVKDDPHNVKLPKHQIPAVEYPKNALSPDMPVFATKGRYREASLSYSGTDTKIKDEYKTITVVIDKTSAVSETDAYSASLKKSGWWVEDYKLKPDSAYLSYEARKGMYKLKISNGRGSGTSDDTIVIESTKFPEGKWLKSWTDARLEQPDKSTAVGEIKAEKSESKNIYETIIFDNVNDTGVRNYADKLVKAGFKMPQNAYKDWDYKKYIRIDDDLYLAEITVNQRMDSLTSFTYDLAYFADGKWHDIWKNGGLPDPDGYDTIVGEIDMEKWAKNLGESYSSSDYETIRFLGLDEKEAEAYLKKLRDAGFIQVKDNWSDSVRLYAYLRIDKKMMRVEVSPQDNEDIAEFSYSFNYYADGEWPKIWSDGGLPDPDGYDAIIGAIDAEKWRQNIDESYSGSDYESIKFLGMDDKKAENYFAKLKTLGFRQIQDNWSDTVRLYNQIKIDGEYYRVEISQNQNDELTEFSYSFNRLANSRWPKEWTDGGLSAPEGYSAIADGISIEKWRQNIEESYSGTNYERIGFAGLDEKGADSYIAKLKSSGFRQIQDNWSDTVRLYNYLRIDGKMCRIEIAREINDELVEFSYSFKCYEDGEWLTAWKNAGIPAPTFTAMLGKINEAEFNETIENYSYYESISMLGANLSEYAALLKRNGFAEPDYSYGDSWELKKRVQFNGKWFIAEISEASNDEVPTINFRVYAENDY